MHAVNMMALTAVKKPADLDQIRPPIARQPFGPPEQTPWALSTGPALLRLPAEPAPDRTGRQRADERAAAAAAITVPTRNSSNSERHLR